MDWPICESFWKGFASFCGSKNSPKCKVIQWYTDRSCTEQIDWQQKYFEPPILRDEKDEDLLSMMEPKCSENIPFLRFPWHKQAVE